MVYKTQRILGAYMNDKSKDVLDAEVVPTQAVAVRQEAGQLTISGMEQSFALAVRQRELLADYIKKQLKAGQHFYDIKGQKKKSLTKEGAEIILLPHNLCPDYEVVSGPQEPPESDTPYQIVVKCSLRIKGHANSFVGSGIGSAGSHRGTWEDKGEDRVWTYQPRQRDKYLCHNATLKMAQKSAMIAATINSTAASEFFTQDMEPEAPPHKAEPPKSKPTEKVPASPESCLKKFISNLVEADLREKATQFLIDLAWLLPTETLEQLEHRYVPREKEQYISFVAKLTNWAVAGKAEKPYEPEGQAEVPRGVPPKEEDAPWRSFPMTHGKHAGVPLCELDKAYLYGLWANFTVETSYVSKKDGKTYPVKPEQIAKAKNLRQMLDEAGKYYNFTKKD